MKHRSRIVVASSLLAVAFAGASLFGMLPSGCAQPECSSPDYGNPECRVLAENEAARLSLADGLEIRFQDPEATSTESWDARGLLELQDENRVRARVAGAGAFAISIEPVPGGLQRLELLLDNVDPAAEVSVGRVGNETPVPALAPGLQRSVLIDLSAGEPVWVRGRRTCPERYRLALTADIQTNPDQFRKIVERLQLEARDAAAAGEPLVALVLAGDLTEASRDDEFESVQEILQQSPVPVAVTAGNHDIFRDLRPHFNDRFGPGNHAFTVCDTQVVLLDTGSGEIAWSVQARLPELLARDEARHLVLGMHHPPHPGLTGSGWTSEDRAQMLLAEAALADVDLLVAGHNHSLRHFEDIDIAGRSLRQIIVGTAGAYQGLGVPRYGYLRLSADPQGLSTCFVEVPPAGFEDPPNDPIDGVPYCQD